MIQVSSTQILVSWVVWSVIMFALGHHTGYYKAWDWWWKRTKQLRREAGWDDKENGHEDQDKPSA